MGMEYVLFYPAFFYSTYLISRFAVFQVGVAGEMFQVSFGGFGGGGNQRWMRTKGEGEVKVTEEGCSCATENEWNQK